VFEPKVCQRSLREIDTPYAEAAELIEWSINRSAALPRRHALATPRPGERPPHFSLRRIRR
jgi:hypothetical protein